MTLLHDLIERHSSQSPDRLALSGFGGDFTYAETRLMTNRIANRLIESGRGVGTRFAIYTPNCGLGVIAKLGSLKAGAAWCNVNLRNTLEDNIDILSRGRCSIIYFHSSVASDAIHIYNSVPSLELAVCLDGDNPDAISLSRWIEGAQETPARIEIDELNDIGWQGSTGGTTGLPKLVQSGHVMISRSAQKCGEILFDIPAARNLAVAPITHAGGFVSLGCLTAGGTNFFMEGTDPGNILNALERHKITNVYLPPTLVYVLLRYPGIKDRDFSKLRSIVTAGSPMAAEKVKEAIELFGPVMCQLYGQTEAGMPLTYIGPDETAEAASNPDLVHRLASCGKKTDLIDKLAILDDQGTVQPNGVQGEIVLTSATVMKRYLDDPVASEEISAFGWHHTGDIGHIDQDGYLYISDRKRDMIISGGFNIFPYEVERALLMHPAVQDCAVVGLAHEKWGEQVTGVIEVAPGSSPDYADIIAFCRDRIGAMKAPKEIVAVDSLPRSAAGKILRRKVRDLLRKQD